MKPKIIQLKQAPVVLVELPTNPSNKEEISIERTKSGVACCISYPTSPGMCRSVSLPMDFPDYVKLLGILSDLIEYQFAECVDSWGSVWNDGSKVYENYKDPVPKKRTAKESFYSLLESENVYTENPYGFEPDEYDDEFWEGIDHEQTVFLEWKYEEIANKWQEAQSRTIDPKRTVVLIRKEEMKCK